MGNANLIGKCGLYCGACGIYRAERDSAEWRNEIAAKHGCSTEQVKCNGCGDLSSECWGNGCKIVLCTRAKGYNHCFECEDYASESCTKFYNLEKNYLEAGVNLRENLQMIQSGNGEEWLQQSEKRFTCKSCGKPISAWTRTCHHCGNNWDQVD